MVVCSSVIHWIVSDSKIALLSFGLIIAVYGIIMRLLSFKARSSFYASGDMDDVTRSQDMVFTSNFSFILAFFMMICILILS